MCVITRVVSVGEADVTTEADLDADGVFATHWRPDGELPEAFFLEVMAQTIGIWSHVHDELTVVPEGDRKADAGLLLSVRGIRIERCVRRGEGTLVCTMSKMMLDDRLAVFEGTAKPLLRDASPSSSRLRAKSTRFSPSDGIIHPHTESQFKNGS